MENESENNINEMDEDVVIDSVHQDELVSSESTSKEVSSSKENPTERKRLLRLPMARIKQIMKSDLECSVVSQDSVVLVTKATELFLEYLGQESIKHTLIAKRKTLLKKDVDTAINSIPHLCFLDGALE